MSLISFSHRVANRAKRTAGRSDTFFHSDGLKAREWIKVKKGENHEEGGSQRNGRFPATVPLDGCTGDATTTISELGDTSITTLASHRSLAAIRK